MASILIVEDDALLRDAFSILLQMQSYDVTEAVNGQDALQKAADKTYDLILLDLMMPVLDGIGFLKGAELAKKAPRTRVVLMSNLSSGEQIDEAMALGVHRREVKSNLSPKDIVKIVKEELETST
jgi:CheY-like chemotaxis protein